MVASPRSFKLRKRDITLLISLGIALFAFGQQQGWWGSLQRDIPDSSQSTPSSPSLNPTKSPSSPPTRTPPTKPEVQGAHTDRMTDKSAEEPAVGPGKTETMPSTETAQPGSYSVVRVSDGDTIRIDLGDGTGKQATLRFIGVDTPETRAPDKVVQCYGREATVFARQLIGTGPVTLATDSKTSDRDRFGRLLRYVYLADGRSVQKELLKGGYAFAYTKFPFTRSDEFVALQLEAQVNKRGLWSVCQPVTNQYGGYTSSPAQ